MATMRISELVAALNARQAALGDVPVVLYDLDTAEYFSLTPESVEAQRMADGSVRVSIGLESYSEPLPYLDKPVERPL